MGPLTCIMNRMAHPVFFIATLFLFFSFIPSGRSQVAYRFDFNTDCRKAYEEIIQLRLGPAKQIIESEKKAHPGNLIPFVAGQLHRFFYPLLQPGPGRIQKEKTFRRTAFDMVEKRGSSFPLLPVQSFSHLFPVGSHRHQIRGALGRGLVF